MCNEPVTRTLSSGFSEAYFFRIAIDRKSTRLNSSHITISYAVFCLKKKKHKNYRNHASRITHVPPSTVQHQVSQHKAIPTKNPFPPGQKNHTLLATPAGVRPHGPNH